jgi:hypothetical protein
VKLAFETLLAQPNEASRPVPAAVALRCCGGQFVRADPSRGGLLVADQSDLGEWSVFLLRRLRGGGVNLAARDGRWVSADRNQGCLLVADRASAWSWSPWSWELFRLEPHGDRVALLASHGRYACAEGGGGGFIRADRPAPAAWEQFTLVDLSAV